MEAVRVGTLVTDRKNYQRWQSHQRRPHAGVGLAGESLERVILSLASSHPDLVALPG